MRQTSESLSKFSAPSVELNLDQLSQREKQVLSLAAVGFLDKQIGEELGISLNTLRTYWSRIRAKSGEAPRTALVVAFASSEARQADPESRSPILHEGWIYDVETNLALASDSINRLHGLECGVPHPPSAYARMFLPEDRENAAKALETVASGEAETSHVRLRLVTPQGLLPAFISVRAVKGEHGKVVKVIGNSTRLLSWREDEEPQVKVGGFTVDLDSGAFLADKACCEIFQVDEREASNPVAFASRLHPSDSKLLDELASESTNRTTGDPREVLITLDDGSQRWLRFLTHKQQEVDERKLHAIVMAFGKSSAPTNQAVESISIASKLSDREALLLGLAAVGFSDSQVTAGLHLQPGEMEACWNSAQERFLNVSRTKLKELFLSTAIAPTIPHRPGEKLIYGGYIIDPHTQMVLATDSMNDAYHLERGKPHARAEYQGFYVPFDKETAQKDVDAVLAGQTEKLRITRRAITPQGLEMVYMDARTVRDEEGRLTNMAAFVTRVASDRLYEISSPKGFWAKDLRTGTFIVPDEEFCKIFRVRRDSPTLDEDIRSRYDPKHRQAAYDFIEEAVRAGEGRGARDFRLAFDDGTDLWIRLEYYIEHDQVGPARITGTVLAFG